ncbi:hypothetical protein D9M70_613330 [compost metagenome]
MAGEIGYGLHLAGFYFHQHHTAVTGLGLTDLSPERALCNILEIDIQRSDHILARCRCNIRLQIHRFHIPSGKSFVKPFPVYAF